MRCDVHSSPKFVLRAHRFQVRQRLLHHGRRLSDLCFPATFLRVHRVQPPLSLLPRVRYLRELQRHFSDWTFANRLLLLQACDWGDDLDDEGKTVSRPSTESTITQKQKNTTTYHHNRSHYFGGCLTTTARMIAFQHVGDRATRDDRWYVITFGWNLLACQSMRSRIDSLTPTISRCLLLHSNLLMEAFGAC